MENTIAFSFTLLGLELAEIEGVKAGAFFTPSLRIYYEVREIKRRFSAILGNTDIVWVSQ